MVDNHKRSWSSLLVFAAVFGAGLIVGAALMVVPSARLAQSAQRSEIVYPTRAVFENLDETLKNGDCELAAKKVALLRQRWQESIEGKSSPSGWYREVIELQK